MSGVSEGMSMSNRFKLKVSEEMNCPYHTTQAQSYFDTQLPHNGKKCNQSPIDLRPAIS